jgi:hypothetical protein
MTGQVLKHQRVLQDGGDFDHLLEAGTGRFKAARLIKSVLEPTADQLLDCMELEALELCFERCRFWVRCDGSSDEIGFSGAPTWPAVTNTDLTRKAPWSSAVGLELVDYAFLVKGVDYHDRLQLDFGADKIRVSLQLEFSACQLSTYLVKSSGGAA